MVAVVIAACLFIAGYVWFLWNDAKAMLIDLDRK